MVTMGRIFEGSSDDVESGKIGLKLAINGFVYLTNHLLGGCILPSSPFFDSISKGLSSSKKEVLPFLIILVVAQPPTLLQAFALHLCLENG